MHTPDYGVVVPMWPGDCPPLPEEPPLFCLVFYNIPRWRFNLIPTDGENRNMGGGIIRAALRRRGLDPDEWWTSFWFIE